MLTFGQRTLKLATQVVKNLNFAVGAMRKVISSPSMGGLTMRAFLGVVTSTLLLFALFTNAAIAGALNVAIYTEADPWPQADADQEVDKLVKAIENRVNVEVFDSSKRAALADWVKAQPKDGKSILILCGTVPSTIYPQGNVEPDGSVLEEFLDAGNTIFNTGQYSFFSSDGAERTNKTDALPLIIDVPDAYMWQTPGPGGWTGLHIMMTPTKEGEEYTPSLKEYESSNLLHVGDYEGTPWELEIALAENTELGLRVDPAVIINTETGGRFGIFVQAYDPIRKGLVEVSFGDIMSEFILNYYLSLTAVEPANRLAVTWSGIKSSR